MNILDKVGEGLASSVDLLVEKNRQLAQLNRLSAVIKTETEVINRAYIALGKQYFKMLEGNAEENDMSQVCEVIKFSEERLRKAQARYDYVKVYGVPSSPVDTVDMIRTAETDDNLNDPLSDNASDEAAAEEDENADITIAVAEESAEESSENAAEQTEQTSENSTDDSEDTEKTVAQKAAETVSYIKRKRSVKVTDDSEAAND